MKFTKKELETILIDVQSEEMVQSLVEMEYKHYLKCDYWKSVREVMHEMVGTECEICGNDLNIHIHHLNYDNRGKETLNDLVCLCGKCHSIVHKSHKGMFANEVFDRTQFIKQAEIVKKISKTFTNKDYLRILPIAQRGVWELEQLKSLFDYSEEEIMKIYANEIENKLIISFIGDKTDEPFKFYALDNILWLLITKDYPKIKKINSNNSFDGKHIAIVEVGD